MTLEEFEKLAAEGYERLPAWVREKIKNVALLIEDEPSEEDRHLQGLSDEETLLGLYKGIPLSERGSHYGEALVLPDTITLYRSPILEAAVEDNIDVRDVVADTIAHEYFHHFGASEEEVRAWEEQRGVGDFRT